MARRARRKFTEEQKAEAVRMVLEGRTVAEVARSLDLTATSLAKWVKAAEVDRRQDENGPLMTSERRELAELRRKNRRLEQEAAFLKKAAAFFAKESDPRTR